MPVKLGLTPPLSLCSLENRVIPQNPLNTPRRPHPFGATNYDRSLNSKLGIRKIYAEQTFNPFDVFVPGTAKKK